MDQQTKHAVNNLVFLLESFGVVEIVGDHYISHYNNDAPKVVLGEALKEVKEALKEPSEPLKFTTPCENCGGTGECETELYDGLTTCWVCQDVD